MVEFKVIFNNKINEKLMEIQTEKTKKNLKKVCSIFGYLSLIILLVAIIERSNFGAFIGCLGFAVFNYVFWLLFPKAIIATTRKQQKKLAEQNSLFDDLTEEVYKFDDDKVFIFTTRGDKYRSAIETDYDYFYSVYEDDNSFILYISEVQCHVIFKEDIQKGTIDEFRELLLKHFAPSQYQTKNVVK